MYDITREDTDSLSLLYCLPHTTTLERRSAMSLADWVHKYPQVQALLQQDTDILDYFPDTLFADLDGSRRVPDEGADTLGELVVQPLPPGCQGINSDRILRHYETALIRTCLSAADVTPPLPSCPLLA
jgi:hypothetical protein